MKTLLTSENARRLYVTLGAFLTLMFFFSPSWGAFRLWSRVPEMGEMLEVRRGVSVLYQSEHLGAPLPDKLHAVIQWRLLFPLLGHLFGLPAWALFGLAHAGALAVLGYLTAVLRRGGAATWAEALAGVVTLGAADWLFVSTGWFGYYDSWVVLGLLVVAFSPRRTAVWLACLLTPWIDERFVIAFPLALLCGLAYRDRKGITSVGWKTEALVAVGLVAAFAILRLWILPGGATPGAYWAALNLSGTPWWRVVWGAWEGLRAGWLAVAVGIVAVLGSSGRARWLLPVVALLTAAVGLATAQDFSRSMLLLTPLALLGAVFLAESGRAKWLRGAALAAVLLPAHHVMNDLVNPIYYFYHELAALAAPPAAAQPDTYELQGIRAMQEGRRADAETALTLAIKLSDNPAGPAKQRGILHASQQRWAEARQDFALVTEAAPGDPDGWFYLAQADAAQGELAAARTHFDQALAVAPPGWNQRPDVRRFQQKFGQR